MPRLQITAPTFDMSQSHHTLSNLETSNGMSGMIETRRITELALRLSRVKVTTVDLTAFLRLLD